MATGSHIGGQVFHGVNLKSFVGLTALALVACGSSQTKAAHGRTSEWSDSVAVRDSASGFADAGDRLQLDTIYPKQVGAEQWPQVLAATAGKRVACVVNHTSLSGGQHLVDRLLASGVEVVRVFAPEHGFRGDASDGEKIADTKDPRTGLPIASLYGKSKRPSREMLADVDVVIFDIQDVGLRFYTYISTMHYVMDAAAEYGKAVVVLDRPNPNGRLVDGPVMDPAFQSFIGLDPIPVAHGMTVGELARMINGEGWLEGKRKCELTVVPVADYRVGQIYELPQNPSPNLPTQNSVYLYPSLCFFEGTVASVGRGTDMPFEVVGHPKFSPKDFAFTPESRPGATYAPLKGETCYGLDFRTPEPEPVTLIDWALLRTVMHATAVETFVDRPAHFDALAGGSHLRTWLLGNEDAASFRESYQAELKSFIEQRKPYLLYDRTSR